MPHAQHDHRREGAAKAATKAPRRAPADKYDERRNQLAESALQTLGELGYARTSLREIANNSEFSHGVVHYYFQDKLELIIYCVRYYKTQCVTRYDAVVADSTTADELLDAFAAKLVETLRDEAPMHRLWYDLRTQSMFEEQLREAVLEIDRTLEEMIWRVVSRYAELAGRAPPRRRRPRRTACSTGSSSRRCSATSPATRDALDDLVAQVHDLMPLMLRVTRRSLRERCPVRSRYHEPHAEDPAPYLAASVRTLDAAAPRPEGLFCAPAGQQQSHRHDVRETR